MLQKSMLAAVPLLVVGDLAISGLIHNEHLMLNPMNIKFDGNLCPVNPFANTNWSRFNPSNFLIGSNLKSVY